MVTLTCVHVHIGRNAKVLVYDAILGFDRRCRKWIHAVSDIASNIVCKLGFFCLEIWRKYLHRINAVLVEIFLGSTIIKEFIQQLEWPIIFLNSYVFVTQSHEPIKQHSTCIKTLPMELLLHTEKEFHNIKHIPYAYPNLVNFWFFLGNLFLIFSL